MHVFLALAALFIVVPILEIFILIQTGRYLGTWTAIGIVLTTGFVGAALARHQGLRAWEHVRSTARKGILPSKELFDGFCILCAGLLMVTPGLLTDLTGFLLLTPPFRSLVRSYLAKRLTMETFVSSSGGVFSAAERRQPGDRPATGGEDNVIDVEAERLDD